MAEKIASAAVIMVYIACLGVVIGFWVKKYRYTFFVAGLWTLAALTYLFATILNPIWTDIIILGTWTVAAVLWFKMAFDERRMSKEREAEKAKEIAGLNQNLRQ